MCKPVKLITPSELKKKLLEKDDCQLIDIREEYDAEITSIGGMLIPAGEIISRVQDIARDKPVIFYCENGLRTIALISKLETDYGFTNLYGLKGGIKAYLNGMD